MSTAIMLGLIGIPKRHPPVPLCKRIDPAANGEDLGIMTGELRIQLDIGRLRSNGLKLLTTFTSPPLTENYFQRISQESEVSLSLLLTPQPFNRITDLTTELLPIRYWEHLFMVALS